MPPRRASRRPTAAWLPTVVPTLQALLEAGHATPGLDITVRGGHLILARADEFGPDPRFRLTPLGVGSYELALHRGKRREPLPYQGSLDALVDVMNSDLQHRAAWS